MSRVMSEQSTNSASLVGRWSRVSSDDEGDPNEEVEMVFTPDGKLVYIISDRDGKHIMNLVYEVAGDTLITDQPSEPRKEYTKFFFESDDVLILEYGDARTWFRREK